MPRKPSAISRYLAAFLMDPRVVDLPRWKWYPLLKAIILPMRSKTHCTKFINLFGQNKALPTCDYKATTSRFTSLFK